MKNIKELSDRITALKQGHSSGKIFFFGKEQDRLRSGFVRVIGGVICSISFLGSSMSESEALFHLKQLDITKTKLAPDSETDVESQNTAGLAIDVVLRELNAAAAKDHAPPAARSMEAAKALALQHDARIILEKFYGSGATRRMEEIVTAAPPVKKPADFLDRCREYLAQMVGPGKAEIMFEPLYARLT